MPLGAVCVCASGDYWGLNPPWSGRGVSRGGEFPSVNENQKTQSNQQMVTRGIVPIIAYYIH